MRTRSKGSSPVKQGVRSPINGFELSNSRIVPRIGSTETMHGTMPTIVTLVQSPTPGKNPFKHDFNKDVSK